MNTKPTADDLVAEYNRIEDHLEVQTKAFSEHIKPARARSEEIKNLLLAMLNEQKCDSFRTEHGTAYKSVIVTPKIQDREKYLDFVLDNWDACGDMLQIGAPQKAALQTYQDEHDGALPPHIETSSFTRINIRRS